MQEGKLFYRFMLFLDLQFWFQTTRVICNHLLAKPGIIRTIAPYFGVGLMLRMVSMTITFSSSKNHAALAVDAFLLFLFSFFIPI